MNGFSAGSTFVYFNLLIKFPLPECKCKYLWKSSSKIYEVNYEDTDNTRKYVCKSNKNVDTHCHCANI